MSWIKLDDRFADHPKIVEAGPEAAWLFICGLCYCARYLTDGLIPKAQVRKLADIEDVKQSVTKLLSTCLWENAEDSYRVHDYLDYNLSREQALELSRKRTEAGSRGGRPSQKKQNETKLVSKTKANVKQNESKTKAVPVPVPVLVFVPESVPGESTSTTTATGARKKPRANGSPPDSAIVWQAFQAAYQERYGTDHPRNAKVNGQMVQFIGRIGLDEAPHVAAYYVHHPNAYYVQKRHMVGLMLQDAEALRTDWKTGKRSTRRGASEEDRLAATGDMYREIMEENAVARSQRQINP